ncbi:hypothetical protein [Amycolatopsis antarctica]|uniref:hypothetical protein n=1 Tax=Amycolatopsis antarctica TaxID=1854586 RepID=UPI00196B083E|nr:hypothetical protein [Amycolatopsis antarctica]
MTAPTRSRTQTGSRPASTGARATTTEQPARSGRQQSRNRTTAAERAYARRAQRAEQVRREPEAAVGEAGRIPALRLRLSRPTSRATFVLMLMGLLVAGVAATLWLTTQSIADSYRLEDVRKDTAGLAERAERLQQDVTREESAFTLADKAKKLGMVPGGDPAHVVVAPDGTTRVVGEPTAATEPAPAAPPAPAAEPAPQEDAPPAPAPVDQAPPPAPEEEPADPAAGQPPADQQAAPGAEPAPDQGAQAPQAGGR